MNSNLAVALVVTEIVFLFSAYTTIAASIAHKKARLGLNHDEFEDKLLSAPKIYTTIYRYMSQNVFLWMWDVPQEASGHVRVFSYLLAVMPITFHILSIGGLITSGFNSELYKDVDGVIWALVVIGNSLILWDSLFPRITSRSH